MDQQLKNQDAFDRLYSKFSTSQVCQMPASVPAPTPMSSAPWRAARSKKKGQAKWRAKWTPRLHQHLDHRDPTVNNFAHFKLQHDPNKGLGVVCVKSTASNHVLVGQYPNCHKKCNSCTNLGWVDQWMWIQNEMTIPLLQAWTNTLLAVSTNHQYSRVLKAIGFTQTVGGVSGKTQTRMKYGKNSGRCDQFTKARN